MRIWMLLIIVTLLSSCKDNSVAPENEMDFKAPNTNAYESIDKSIVYENMIRAQFNSLLEANILRNKNDSINAVFKEDLDIIIPAHLEFKSLQLSSIDKSQSIALLYGTNDLEYFYDYKQIFWDSLKREEVTFTGIIAIDEQQQVIDNETINTVKIIW